MKKHTLLRALLLAVLALTLTLAASAAYSFTLYDGDTVYGSIADGQMLPSSKTKGTSTLYNWQDKTTGYFYGWNPLPVPSGSIDLYAVWVPMTKAVPGKNAMLNGTFDDDIVYLRPSNGGVRIVTEADGNRVLEYARGSGYASLQFYVGWDAGRKYHVSYRVKAPGVATSNHNPRYAVSDGSTADHPIGTATTVADTWVSASADFTIPATMTEVDDLASGFFSLYVNPIDGLGSPIYYDDIELIPYVRVSYHALGGSGEPEDEYILDGTVTVSSTVPVRRGFTFGGWSLTEGGTTAVTSVEITGGDIDLYAIWNAVGAQDVVSYTYSTEKSGLADGSLAVIAPEEAADCTDVTVYFADADGIMDGYTPFATFELTDGVGVYTTTKNRVFAPGATRLSVHLTADGKDDIVYWYDIPESRRFDDSESPLFTFYAVSDIHMSDYWPEITVNRARMLNDVIANEPAFTVIAGDLVNNGVTAEYERVDNYLKTNFNDAGRAAFITNGNHEFHISDKNSTEYDRNALLNTLSSQIEANRAMGYTVRRDGNDLWYSAIIKGRKFIFLSTPSTPAGSVLASYVVSDEQLAFLREELEAAESTGYPAFVVSHVPLSGYVPTATGYSSGISNTAAVVAVLNDFPGTTVITAHTHSNLSLDRQYVVASEANGSLFTHLNDGCAVWLEEGTTKIGIYEVAFSAGQVIDVYADRLVIKARKFDDTSVYFGHGLYEIKLPGNGSPIPNFTLNITRPFDGATVQPVFPDGTDTSDYHYEWIIGGKTYSSAASFTIEADSSMAGKYVLLRVSDSDGHVNYAKTSEPFTAVTLHYDANGGSGSVPSDTKVFNGVETRPDALGSSPYKSGSVFVGWSTDKNATVPMVTLTPTADTTLYAVYSDKMLFDFDASLSGWIPNSMVKTYDVKDSCLFYTSDPLDMYFTLSNISFSADDHPYMRIKRRYDSGSGDGMFFSIKDGGGFSQAQRIPLVKDTGTVVATIGDMQVVEYDLTALVGTYWKGTVNKLRYDVLASGGAGATDYIAFSDKHGIYTVGLTFDTPTVGTTEYAPQVALSSDTANCTLESAVWSNESRTDGAYTLRVVLAPKDGYEFTTVRDLLSIVNIPAGKVYEASIDENGKATVCALVYPTVGSLNATSNGKHLVSFEKALEHTNVAVVSYSSDGRPTAVKLVKDVTSASGTFMVEGVADGDSVKAFAFGSLIALKPDIKAADGVSIR